MIFDIGWASYFCKGTAKGENRAMVKKKQEEKDGREKAGLECLV
jgi:hypothetical protein